MYETFDRYILNGDYRGLFIHTEGGVSGEGKCVRASYPHAVRQLLSTQAEVVVLSF